MIISTELIGRWTAFDLSVDASADDVIDSVLMSDLDGVRDLATDLGLSADLMAVNFCEPNFFAENGLSFSIERDLQVDGDDETVVFKLNVFKH